MKKIIDGVIYDTETMIVVHENVDANGDNTKLLLTHNTYPSVLGKDGEICVESQVGDLILQTVNGYTTDEDIETLSYDDLISWVTDNVKGEDYDEVLPKLNYTLNPKTRVWEILDPRNKQIDPYMEKYDIPLQDAGEEEQNRIDDLNRNGSIEDRGYESSDEDKENYKYIISQRKKEEA